MTANLIPQKINQMIDGRYLIFYAALTVAFLAVSYDEKFSFITTACCYDCISRPCKLNNNWFIIEKNK